MLSLHTNAAALSAQNSITKTQSALSTSMTRLSTGYRINSAMDDAAGLQIATRLKAQTSGMAVAMRNTQNSISMLQVADGALNEVSNILVRMKDLATQAADASSTVADQKAMQDEYDALGKELNNIMNNTTFGGSKLLKGGTIEKSMTFQIGATKDEKMDVDLSTLMTDLDGTANGDVDTIDGKGMLAVSEAYDQGAIAGSRGGELFDVTNYDADPTTALASAGADKARLTIDVLSGAIDLVGAVRSGLGAASNRLEHVYNNLNNISTNTQNATGRIMDVDFASESSNMTSNQMLLQAGTAMLKQTNSMSSMVMSLLQ
ncbi:flagellin N-terminal helical domain-containing protein [Massilia horti]|uniref:Flagellin n=1 Tax=Massilia horti TaxID=2562153 RepID=A0A4Y9SW94_9BURK|nr:flagellin [Massilia horti]TFW28996.1 Lateral flagellin [Massilia horti]